MYFDEKALGKKSISDKTLIKLPKSPANMAGSLKKKPFSKPKETKTRFLSANPNDFCDRFKFSLQEKQAGNNSDIKNEEIVAIVDRLLEHKCISTKQYRLFY